MPPLDEVLFPAPALVPDPELVPTHFYRRGFRMCRSHTHWYSQSRIRTAATAIITLRMILRTGPLLGPNSIIPGLPEANVACKKEIGPRGRLFPPEFA
jgi:hypothetical protein